jgi:hypothetical protein
VLTNSTRMAPPSISKALNAAPQARSTPLCYLPLCGIETEI